MSSHRRNTRHCRRKQPSPWQAGPPPPPASGPPDVWKKPPWQDQHRRGRGQWCPPGPWGPRPFPGPADFRGNEDRRWAPHNGPPPPPWDNGGHEQGPEDGFKEPGPWDPTPFPGPADFHGSEENRTWKPPDCPPPPPWGHREDNQGHEDFFREGWYPELPGPDCFAVPEFPEEKRHPRRLPSNLPGERGAFQRGHPAWGYRCLGRKHCQRFRHRELTVIQHLPCLRPSRGNQPRSRSSSLSGKNQRKAKEGPQHRDPPQPLIPSKDYVQSKEKTAQDPPVVSTKVPEPPEPTGTPPKSPAADPQAAREPEQAEGAMLVDVQKPAGTNSQGPSALETEPAPPEESSAGTGGHLEVETCNQSVPKAGEDGMLHPDGLTGSPERAERVHAAAGSVGEQHLLSGAGEGEAEAAHDRRGLQPPKSSQVPPGAATKPDAQAGSDTSSAPETSPGTQHPSGSAETEPAAGSQRQLCSALPKSYPASKDLRSKAILAKMEEIELSYQRFSLTVAAVATMLLQKEPSMEAPLGLALRANLRQGCIYHLRELEDFINSYDSATLSR